MCGIAGQVTGDRRPVEESIIAGMGECLAHRGPDDRGVFVKGHVGLAHRRLSILDLTPAGRQPMSNASRTIWTVFNGEIYNFEELRRMLRTPRVFRSRTDTEVLLYLYEDFGVECVSMLRGMFAFAIWDETLQRLILARDRLGKKPLFYSLSDTSLTFASELKALLRVGTGFEVDPVAIHHYLTFQYVPAPLTIFKGVRKLLPGHLLIYEKGKTSESSYWTLSYNHKHPPRPEREYQEQFKSLLQESVGLRLTSDVPLGAFLSGGVDSGTVVALMASLLPHPVKTFSIGFKEGSFNELPYAREIAEMFGTDHEEFVVEPSAVEILATLVRVYDEPYADSSAIPTYYLAQLSRQFVTVVLSGDGGDELLGGYSRYALTWWDRLTARPGYMANPGRWPRQLLKGSRSHSEFGTLPKWVHRILGPLSRTYLGRLSYFPPSEKQRLYTPDFRQAMHGHNSYDLLAGWFEEIQASEPLDQLLGVDTRSYLPDDLLVKVDRATMAHGLEVRSPFLDHRLVEFAAALPTNLKIRNRETKYLLKAVMRGVLPDPLLNRRKHGFSVPLDRWFRQECRGLVRDILLSTRCLGRGYFMAEYIRGMLDDHQEGKADLGYRLYALLMLELWHREYVDGVSA